MIRSAGSRLLALPLALALLGAAPKVEVGKPAPDAEFTLVSGEKIALSQLRGQVVVINFWATWCVPCREELPLLDSYYRVVGQRGVRVFAVTTEDSLPLYQMKKLFKALAITPARHVKGPYPVLGGVPTNYIIDRAGRVRYAKSGAFDLDDLNRELVPLINEEPPAG